MTRDEAEDLVQELIYAVRSDERTPSYSRKYAMAEVKEMKEKVIAALVSQSSAVSSER